MAKNIVIITGSPRAEGNSNILAEAFKMGAEKAGNAVKCFDAHNKRIDFYSAATYLCEDNTADAKELHDLLGWADVLVFVSPVYFMGVTAGLKTVMDRLSPYATQDGKQYFKAKEACLISTATSKDPDMFQAVNLEYDYLMMKLGVKTAKKILVGGVADAGAVLALDNKIEEAITAGYTI